MERSIRERIEDEARTSLWQDDGPDACPYEYGSEEWHVWMSAWTDAYEASNRTEDPDFDYEENALNEW